jgi:hypothetical protein
MRFTYDVFHALTNDLIETVECDNLSFLANNTLYSFTATYNGGYNTKHIALYPVQYFYVRLVEN